MTDRDDTSDPRDDLSRDDLGGDDLGSDDLLREALEGWPSAEPPADFADRVMAARAEELGESEAEPPSDANVQARARPSVSWVRRALPAVAAAAAVAVVTVGPDVVLPSTGSDHVVTERRALEVGRARLVAEAGAELDWSVSLGGAAVVDQRRGSVFYRAFPGDPLRIETPAGAVTVTGTCFQVEVIPMSTQSSLPQKSLVSAALGAVVGAGLVVTVYEGSVVLTQDDHTVTLEASERAVSAEGHAPVKIDDLRRAEAARAEVALEREKLRGQVDELEAQLKTLMIAKANGTDPLVAENGRLTEQVARLKAELDVAEQIRDVNEGRPFEFPEGISDAYRQDAVRQTIAEALVAAGIPGDIESVDCAEFPCLVHGHTKLPGDDVHENGRVLDEAFRTMQQAIQKKYPDDKNSYSNSSWGDYVEDGPEGKVSKRYFGVAVMPKGVVPEEDKAAFSRRMRWRNEQLREAQRE